MNISVIIPCYNGAATIAGQLEALAQQEWPEPWEIIISDNGSTDESLAIVDRFRTRLPHLRVVDSSERRSRSHARNIGARAALGQSLLFCDADDEVNAGWLAAMGQALSKYDFVACRVDFAKLNKPWIAHHFRNHHQRVGLQKTWYPPYFLHAGGSTIGIKRALHEAVGGFDESFKRLQDTDYCYRVQRLGVKLQFVQDAVVHVRWRERLTANFRQSLRIAEYSVLMYKRYGRGHAHSGAWRRYAEEWQDILRNWTCMFSRETRYGWTCRVAWQIGFLLGSIKHRVPPVSW